MELTADNRTPNCYNFIMIIWTDLLNPWMVAFLCAGLFLFFKKSLLGYGFPRPLELAIVTVCLMIYAFHFSLVVIVPYVDNQQSAEMPCAPANLELQCYNLSKNNCSRSWEFFEKECKKEALENLNPKRLTSLVGATVKKCVLKRLDRSFRSTRKIVNEGDPCQIYFSQLDAPSL